MTTQLIDIIIFSTTSIAFVWYQRRQRNDTTSRSAIALIIDVSDKKPSVVINRNIVIDKQEKNERNKLEPSVVNSRTVVIDDREGDKRDRGVEIKLETESIEDDTFREQYKPWAITPSAFAENKKGWVYVRGYSPIERGGSVLWCRLGLHKISVERHEEYFRALLHGVETCVKDALQRSNGKNGKCNIVIDASGVGFSYIPPINITKKILPIFDQLFSGRFGNLVVVNMAMAAQIFFKVVMPFLPDNVQSKIHILPKNSEEASNMLKSLVEEEFIPTWLGGRDNYVFNADEYYNTGKYKSAFISDNEGVEYNKLMTN